MNQSNQQLVKTSIVVVIIAALIGVMTILLGNVESTSAKVFGKLFTCSLSLIFFGITAAVSHAVIRKPGYYSLAATGMAMSVIAFLLSVIMIVTEMNDVDLLKLFFSSFIASVGLAHICLLHHFTLQNKYAFFARVTATLAISLFSLLVIVQIFQPFPSLFMLTYDPSTLKLVVASLVVDLAATLLVRLCNLLEVQEVPKLPFAEEQQTGGSTPTPPL